MALPNKALSSLHHRKSPSGEIVFFRALEFSKPQLVAIILGTVFDAVGSFITPRLRGSTPHVRYFAKCEANPPKLETAGITNAFRAEGQSSTSSPSFSIQLPYQARYFNFFDQAEIDISARVGTRCLRSFNRHVIQHRFHAVRGWIGYLLKYA